MLSAVLGGMPKSLAALRYVWRENSAVRPVFLWNAKRIRAHIAICYMAFSLIRFLQNKLQKEANIRLSPEKIRSELYRVQDSILIDTETDQKYVIPSKPSSDALKIYHTMEKKRVVVPFKMITKR